MAREEMKMIVAKNHMLLRSLTAGAIALAVAGTPATLAHAQEKITLRISTASVLEDWHTESLEVFKTFVEESMEDRFDVQIFANSSLYDQGTELPAMQRCNLEMAYASMQTIARQIPEYSIFTTAYLIRDPAHQDAVFNGPIGEEVYARVKEELNLVVLNSQYLGTRQLNLRDVRDVQTPADLAGVKLRMPGTDAWQFLGEALGASPTPLAFTEVFTGLQTGTIDGQDNPLPTNKSARFYEVTEQIVLTGHLVDGVFLTIAGCVWDKLSDEEKSVIRAAAQAADKYNDFNRIRDEASLLDFFRDEGLTITTPDVEAFRTQVQEAYMNSDFSDGWPEGMLERINAAGM